MITAELVALEACHVQVLQLLVAGHTLRAIANKASLSQRTVATRVTEIMRGLAAGTRLQAGAEAVHRGYVNRSYVTRCAAGRRRHAEQWVEPTMRQLEILRPLANGASVDQVAAEIGMSTRTVRREVSSLAAANGARNDWSLGALAAALHWT